MANTFNVFQWIAREGAAMLLEEAPFLTTINRGLQDEFQKSQNGFQVGDTVYVTIPPNFKVFDGAVFAGGGNAPDIKEKKIPLKLDTQKHVPFTLTAVEKALSMNDENLARRVLRPAINNLGAMIQADVIKRATLATYNLVGTPGTTPNSTKTINQVRGVMEQFLAPNKSRTMLLSTDTNIEITDATKNLLNPNKAISDQFINGYMNSGFTFDMFECQSLYTHTNGSKVTGVTVSGAGQSGTTLAIGGLTAGDTIKAGSVFTVPGVYAVHPLTGIPYPKLRQFVVTQDFTATGATGSISISPEIVLPSATVLGNVSAGPASGAALSFVGAASASYLQNLAYHENAFAFACAKLPILTGCEGYVANVNGISLRVQKGGDFTNDRESTRIDAFYGFAPVGDRADHACRLTQ